ncbi:MAG: flavin reductase family protein [Solirubrobacteraceae bacterium]|nr:flavin reductase family protein [Solirubrobacteraceae bacterium]
MSDVEGRVVESRAFRDAFGAFATGVAVVTAQGPDGPVGLTTNAVTSVSLDPPLFLVCFATSSRTLEVVRDAGALAVSVLRHSQEPMAVAFASKHDHAVKFQGIALADVGGVPAIAGAATAVSGTIDELVHAGDHDIVICRATAIQFDEDAEPLLFHRGRFGALAAEAAPGPEEPSGDDVA